MQLQAGLVKIGIGVSLSFLMMVSALAGIEDSLNYYDTDDYGNVVYFGLGNNRNYDVILVDGSATVGMFASASIPIIQSTREAGYAVVPANSFQQMSDNVEFAKIYAVDCDRKKIEDEDGTIIRLSNASAFHQTTSSMVCSVLEN